MKAYSKKRKYDSLKWEIQILTKQFVLVNADQTLFLILVILVSSLLALNKENAKNAEIIWW